MTLKQDFRRFVMPEPELSLKLVFDNVRNYAICGAVLGVALWLESGKAIAQPIGRLSDGGMAALTLASYAIFWVLLGLNACQSFYMGWKALGFDALKGQGQDPDWESRNPWYVNILVHTLIAALTIAMMLSIFLLAVFALYLAWFAAVGGRG